MKPTVEYSNLAEHIQKTQNLKDLIKNKHLYDPNKHNFYYSKHLTDMLNSKISTVTS